MSPHWAIFSTFIIISYLLVFIKSISRGPLYTLSCLDRNWNFGVNEFSMPICHFTQYIFKKNNKSNFSEALRGASSIQFVNLYLLIVSTDFTEHIYLLVRFLVFPLVLWSVRLCISWRLIIVFSNFLYEGRGT